MKDPTKFLNDLLDDLPNPDPLLDDAIWEDLKKNLRINQPYVDARTAIPRSDPMALDLDGDGLETVGIESKRPILFDHDGDGIKTGTAWLKSDDGILVLDRNGNGAIDSGRELFGNHTLLASGQQAADGYAALAELDGNADGAINAQDARWGQLRFWRDLNLVHNVFYKEAQNKASNEEQWRETA